MAAYVVVLAQDAFPSMAERWANHIDECLNRHLPAGEIQRGIGRKYEWVYPLVRYSLGRFALEAERVQVRVLHDESKSDGLTGQRTEIRGTLPGNPALDVVAENLTALRQREAWDRECPPRPGFRPAHCRRLRLRNSGRDGVRKGQRLGQ